jgi:hypothetical protein
MLSKTLAWKYVLPLLFVMALAGGVIGGLVAELASEDNEPGLTRGGVIVLGPPDTLYGNPFCIEAQHVCVSQLGDGKIVALYMYDTHPLFRGQDCSVYWEPELKWQDSETGAETDGWFRGDCSGSVFRLNGERIFGPSSRDLDRFDIALVGPGELEGYLEVDTRYLTCGHDHGGDNPGCDFAPLPQ